MRRQSSSKRISTARINRQSTKKIFFNREAEEIARPLVDKSCATPESEGVASAPKEFKPQTVVTFFRTFPVPSLERIEICVFEPPGSIVHGISTLRTSKIRLSQTMRSRRQKSFHRVKSDSMLTTGRSSNI